VAKDDIAAAGVAARHRVAIGRADDQVGEAVAIDVASASDATAATVVAVVAVDDEAAVARGNGREFDGSTRALAEDQIAAASTTVVRSDE